MPTKPSDTIDQATAGDGLSDQDLTLTEFCLRLSSADRRVEMIAGFEHAEKAAGRVKGTQAEFAGRYAAFTTKPV